MSLLPRSRMIFLLRDGRDVIDSLLDARTGEGWIDSPNMDLSDPAERLEYVRRQARLWLNATNAVQSAYAAHPAKLRWMLRYEDLLSDPLGTVGPLADWLGLGPRGVFVAIATAFSSLAVLSAVLFRRGRWKTRVV
jgi:non-ribosomal peptide synthetase component F